MKDNEAVFGPSARGEYAPGDHIHFWECGRIACGEVLHCAAPQMTVGGRYLPTSYAVYCSDGFPHIVLASEIVAEV